MRNELGGLPPGPESSQHPYGLPPAPPPPQRRRSSTGKAAAIIATSVVVALILIVAFTLNSRRSTPASNAVSATPTPTVATLPTVQASSEAPPAPTAQTAEVGASVPFVWSYLGAADRGVATLNSAAWSTDPGPYGSLKYGAVLNLDVTIEATAGTVDVNPFYWQAKDAEGRTYSIGMVMEPEPQLQSGNVRSGEKSRGWVSIEAPQGPVTVQLVDGLDSSPKAEWSVN